MNYAKLFTKRKDGTYQKYVNGKYLYSKDPEQLYKKWQAYLAGPPEKTFGEVIEEWAEQHEQEVGVRTWNNYKPHVDAIKSKFANILISEISALDILTDLKQLKAQGYSATIIKTKRAIYNQAMDYAVVKGYCKFNPIQSIKTPSSLNRSERRAPTEEETKIIFNSLDAPFGFFAFFLICTGMRKSEALALTKPDIDLQNRIISVSKTLEYVNGSKPTVKEPKTAAGKRTVPIVNVLVGPLKDWLNGVDEIVFPSPKSNRNQGGGYMTTKAYDIAWAKWQEYTGLNLTAHQLRHGTATILYEAGVDLYTAKNILGHASITTTLSIYTELREKQFEKSAKSFNDELAKYNQG